jgi:hypothetical protein
LPLIYSEFRKRLPCNGFLHGGARAECDVNGLQIREKPAFVALAESNPENVTLAEEKPANVEFDVRIPADLTPSLLGDL